MAKGKASRAVTRSSGNVFADLGLPRADERQTQVRLAVAIHQIIQERRLSQTAAADLLGISQPKISALVNYQLDGFSVERLLRFLNALGRDVEIVVRRIPKSRKPGRILVSAA
jgi:predicted XRE-type DNA-binding protein